MTTYKCKICGEIFNVPAGEEAVCPKCRQKGDKLEVVEAAPASKYAGTQTEKNLEAAFAGESMARNKYTYFASKAKKEGFEQIAALFLKTADNEKEHAKMWFKELHDGIGDTAHNLADAADGENYEWTDMYSGFAKSDIMDSKTRIISQRTLVRGFGNKWSVPIPSKLECSQTRINTGFLGLDRFQKLLKN